MTEDACTTTSSSYAGFPVGSDASHTRKRRKRKWDQPAECFVSTNDAIFAVVPRSSSVSLIGTPVIPLPRNAPVASRPTNAPILKTQDDLVIAREIIINDADSITRHRLTKRQTQEEILKCTGAIVITRGKYHPPNAFPNNEKPLYLHVYCGAHIKDTSERILAVDHAAAMIEEMLKQGRNLAPAPTCQMEMVNGEKTHHQTLLAKFVDPM